jgi:alkylation response protein AidB-like acyl-CoA dehydrogenase
MSTNGGGSADVLQSFTELAADFARKELVAAREEHDRYPFAPFWSDIVAKAFRVGFFGITLPAAHGGTGLAADSLVPVLRELSRADASLSALIFTHAAALGIIAESGRGEEADAVYRAISADDGKPLAFQASAHPDEIGIPSVSIQGDIHRLTGKIDFLSAGPLADYAVVAGSDGSGEEFSSYLVALKGEGVSISPPVMTLGFHACPVADIELVGARGRLLGEKGRGREYCRRAWPRLSLAAAAISLGIIEGSCAEARAYAQDRIQGGRRIIGWPEVRMILAGMERDVRFASAALAEACRMFAAGDPGWEVASVSVALGIGEAASSGAVDGIQVLGGNGYMADYGQEKRMRDAKQAQMLLGMPALRRLELVALDGNR